jgi:hypothetical protein
MNLDSINRRLDKLDALHPAAMPRRNRNETRAGRGYRPRWLVQALKDG